MRVAIVGSRNVKICDFSGYITKENEIVSGGAAGVDRSVAEYAKANGIKITEIFPEYARYGRGAPIVRNKKIVDMAERVVVFWDGYSKGAYSVIHYAEKAGKPCEVVICK